MKAAPRPPSRSKAGGSDNNREVWDLGGPALSVWAKSDHRRGEWLPLPQHMLDSLGMAEKLFDNWLAPGIRSQWGATFPGGEKDARIAFTFLAAAHDVGKASPVFVSQLESMAQRCRQVGLDCPAMDRLKDHRRVLPHATVSYHALLGWLAERGVPKSLARQLASVVGAHHGKPVTKLAARYARERAFPLGGDQWSAIRGDLLSWLDGQVGLGDRLASWAGLRVPLPVQVGMSGLVVMADWLASNAQFLPLWPIDDELVPGVIDAPQDRLTSGWAQVAMPPAWSPPEVDLPATDLYRARFGWEESWSPRPLQSAAVHLVREQPVGLMIVEAEMGSGKTEVAFAVGEILAHQWGAQGLFVALPTQATSDAMYSRMHAWLARLPNPPADRPAWALTLAHGKASLNKLYAEEVEAVRLFEAEYMRTDGVAHIYDEEGEADLVNAVPHQWFNGRKRRLLSNFGVGTIDQLLMAGLKQRHLMLRHLALAGKVVVIDEVHASDAFMNVYLDTVLNWLGHYQVPVILLSATLTRERKEAMLAAYAPEVDHSTPAPVGYPLITWVSADRVGVGSVVLPASSPEREVRWYWHQDDDEGIADLLRDRLRDGGCALVVRNTVSDAQRTAEYLNEQEIAPVLLCHARFIAADRAANDQELLALFGQGATVSERPDRAIVVATQVVEQSLDVDFDFLVTDLAPMDLLFQRIGRLHRHQWRTRPGPLGAAEVHLLTRAHGEVLPRGSSGSHAVYGDHHLLRTSWVLRNHGPKLSIPGDIAPLTQRAIGSDSFAADGELGESLNKAKAAYTQLIADQEDRARQFCLERWEPEGNSGHDLGHWLPLADDPSEALLGGMVRDATPTLEVILVPLTPDGVTALVPPWMEDSHVLDTSSLPDDDTARRIASWSVKLPPRLTRWSGDIDRMIEAIGSGPVKRWAWHKHRLLKGELFLPMRQICEGSNVLETEIAVGKGIRLRYSQENGLQEVTE